MYWLLLVILLVFNVFKLTPFGASMTGSLACKGYSSRPVKCPHLIDFLGERPRSRYLRTLLNFSVDANTLLRSSEGHLNRRKGADGEACCNGDGN